MANAPQKLEGKFHFLGKFCEVSLVFKQPSTNAPINVLNQSFAIKQKVNETDSKVIGVRTLKPFSPTGNAVGEYKTTFLSDGLNAGDYFLEAKGYYPDTTEDSLITYSEDIQIYQVDTVESYINILRVALSDLVTSLFLIDDPTKNKWSDGDLYLHLERSVASWNETAPLSLGNRAYNLDNFPYLDILIMGAELAALDSKALLELYNTLRYSDDINFQIDRFPMLMQKMQFLSQIYYQRVEKMKKDELFRLTHFRAVRSTKIPTRALRSLSFVPQFSFLSAAY